MEELCLVEKTGEHKVGGKKSGGTGDRKKVRQMQDEGEQAPRNVAEKGSGKARRRNPSKTAAELEFEVTLREVAAAGYYPASEDDGRKCWMMRMRKRAFF